MAAAIRFESSEIVPMMRMFSREVFSRSAGSLYQRAASRIDPLPGSLVGAEAAEYLARQVLRLDAELSVQARAFPSHWWMLLLRYISPVIFACDGGNYSRYRGYAERVSAGSTRRLDGVSASAILDGPQIKRAILFVITAAVSEDLRFAAGMVNCGAGLEPAGNSLPKLVMSDELRESVSRFDTQLRLLDQSLLTRMGAAYLTPLEPRNVTLARILVALSALELPITPESFRADELADLVQFAPVLVVLDPNLAELPWADIPRDLGVRIRVLTTIMRLAFVDIDTRPTLWQRLHETGLINRPEREFDSYLTQLCAEANDWGAAMFPGSATVTRDDALSVMTDTAGGRSGRYYGPAVRPGHDFFCVDLLATWLRVESAIATSTSGGGPVPNIRAGTWERTVRAAIDRTEWKPNPALATAVARPLKRDGRIFSDLDAAGARAGVLLIVSCKSWQMTEKYDNLDYSARKNRAADVIRAARKLIMDISNISPLADKLVAPYKLTRIDGVICVSMPLLLTPTETAELREVAPGIVVLTLPELVSQLSGTPPNRFNPHSWPRYLTLSHLHEPHKEL